MIRNADKLHYPFEESICSVLPLVDEFIIALGKGDEDDRTREVILSIDSPKIKIFDRVWDEKDFKESLIFAKETNFALSQCSGDWCIYIQADEVLHEIDYPVIKDACIENLTNHSVDGFLFNYYHFFGDYDHYLPYHGWYRNEIRIVRNRAGIYSFKDAQSFRKADDEKLKVLPLDAYVYHYGWVRPPEVMSVKKEVHHKIHHGPESTLEEQESIAHFDYGPLGRVPKFKSKHPQVMKNRIRKIFWKEKLNYRKSYLCRPKMKHERLKYRLLTRLEELVKTRIFDYSNWEVIK